MAHRITEHRVRSLKPRAKRYTLADDGLQVEIHPTGRISLYWKYRQNSKQHRELIGTYTEMNVKSARDRVRDLQSKLTNSTTPRQAAVTFSEFIEGDFSGWCLANRRDGAATIARVKYQFYPNWEFRRLRDITRPMVDQYLTDVRSKYAPSTTKRNLADLRRVFTLAVTWGYLRVSPAVGVKSPRVDTEGTKLYLDETEFKALTKSLIRWDYLSHFGTPSERRYHPQWFVIWLKIILNTGARRGESLKLRWQDIDTQARTITFTGATTKNARTRSIPISDQLADALTTYAPEEDTLPTAPLFPVLSVKKPFRRFQEMSGLPQITPHLLRHHVASTLVLRGAPLSVVRDLLGHSDISVTSRYLSVRQADKLEALNLL